MTRALHQNVYSLDFGFMPADKLPPEHDPLGPIQYPCVFWADHLCALDSRHSELRREFADDGRVYEFLLERFLYWIESISLLGKLSEGIQSIRRLLRTVQVSISRMLIVTCH